MKNYDKMLSPCFLLAIGLISLSGIDLFGSAILEGAMWKQNVILALMVIFGMLPQTVQSRKPTWMFVGYALGFFMFGGANFIGTVGIMLILEKIILAVLALFMAYRLWAETWNRRNFYIVFGLGLVLCVAMLFPIKDENIVGSGINALIEWSSDRFTSDHGFHIYLGLAGIFAAISEFLIRKQSPIIEDTLPFSNE